MESHEIRVLTKAITKLCPLSMSYSFIFLSDFPSLSWSWELFFILKHSCKSVCFCPFHSVDHFYWLRILRSKFKFIVNWNFIEGKVTSTWTQIASHSVTVYFETVHPKTNHIVRKEIPTEIMNSEMINNSC